MQTKLALINYYYTEISMLNREGGSFYRPIFFDFPNEELAYYNTTQNVMLGKNLKVSQATDENFEVRHFYFPEGSWCTVFNDTSVESCIEGPKIVPFSAGFNETIVHIKDGSIVPLQTLLVNEDSEV